MISIFIQYHLYAIIASFTDGNKQKKRTDAINAAALFQALKKLELLSLRLGDKGLELRFLLQVLHQTSLASLVDI